MSRLTVYLGILSVTLIAAYLLGLIDNTGTSTILNWLVNPESFLQTNFYSELLVLIGLAAVSIITIGFFTIQRTDLAIFSVMVGLLLFVGKDLITIYQNIKVINADFALLFFSPFLLIYILTVIEWWRTSN